MKSLKPYIATLILLFTAGLSYGQISDADAISHYESGQIKHVFYDMGSSGIQIISFYESGSIRELGYIKEGSAHGEWTKWNEDGQKTAQAEYNQGRKIGTWQFWNADGALTHELVYQNGQLADAELLSVRD